MEEVNQPQFESMSQKRALKVAAKNFMIALCVMLCWVKYHIAVVKFDAKKSLKLSVSLAFDFFDAHSLVELSSF